VGTMAACSVFAVYRSIHPTVCLQRPHGLHPHIEMPKRIPTAYRFA
jgi:hypothetical protein